MLSDNWIQTPVSLTPVSTRNPDTCFPTPVSKRNRDTCFLTPVSKRKQDTCFLTPDSKRNQDTCFLTPVSWNHIQIPVSRHLFHPKQIRHLFPDFCLPKKNPVSGQLFPTFFVKKNVGLKYDKACLTTLYNGKKIFCLKDIACSKDFTCSKDFAYPNSWIGKFVISCFF